MRQPRLDRFSLLPLGYCSTRSIRASVNRIPDAFGEFERAIERLLTERYPSVRGCGTQFRVMARSSLIRAHRPALSALLNYWTGQLSDSMKIK
jgi:hypothetical protein